MIFSQIRLGAQRTSLVIRTKFELQRRTRLAATHSFSRVIRNASTAVLAASTVIQPIPLHAAVGQTAEDAGPVPDLSRKVDVMIGNLHLAPELLSAVTSDDPALQPVELGKSVATLREEEELRQAEQQKLELERQKQEKEKALAVERQKAQLLRTLAVLPQEPQNEVQEVAHNVTLATWGEKEWSAMHALIMRESGYNPQARNPVTGACGIPQAFPCSKIADRSVIGQIQWMVNYIKNRYGTPSIALQFHNTYHYY